MALAAGAKFVYAVEIDPQRAAITQVLLQANFDKSRFKVLNIMSFGTGITEINLSTKLMYFLVRQLVPQYFVKVQYYHGMHLKRLLPMNLFQYQIHFQLMCMSGMVKDLFNENNTSLRNQMGISEVVQENTLDPRIEKTLRAFDKFYFNFSL